MMDQGSGSPAWVLRCPFEILCLGPGAAQAMARPGTPTADDRQSELAMGPEAGTGTPITFAENVGSGKLVTRQNF